MANKHTGKRQEDYLEAILILSRESDGVRARDLAAKLNLNKSTIVPMIEKLAKEGLVKHEKYGDIMLTPSGIEKAQTVYKKHLGLLLFLKDILKISDEIAQVDACNLEHYISDKTIEQLIKFVEFFRIKVARNNKTFKQLEEYYKTGNYICEKHTHQDIIKLSTLNKDEKAIILKINGNKPLKNSYFLSGLQPGAIVTIINIDKDKNMLIKNIEGKEQILKITLKEAKNILVEKM